MNDKNLELEGYFERIMLCDRLVSNGMSIENIKSFMRGWLLAETHLNKNNVELSDKYSEKFAREHYPELVQLITNMNDLPKFVIAIVVISANYNIDTETLTELSEFENNRFDTRSFKVFGFPNRWHLYSFDDTDDIKKFETILKSIIIKKDSVDYTKFVDGIPIYYFGYSTDIK